MVTTLLCKKNKNNNIVIIIIVFVKTSSISFDLSISTNVLVALPLRLLIGQREPALRGHIGASSSSVHLMLFSSLHGEGLILKYQLVNGDSFEPKAKNKKQSPCAPRQDLNGIQSHLCFSH